MGLLYSQKYRPLDASLLRRRVTWRRRDAGRICGVSWICVGLGENLLCFFPCRINLVKSDDGEILDQPFLDPVQAKVIGVKLSASVRQERLVTGVRCR